MATPPTPTMRHYAALGQRHGASIPRCVAAHARLTSEYDPRHRPPHEQPTWIAVQDRLHEALALILDCARFAAEEGRVAA